VIAALVANLLLKFSGTLTAAFPFAANFNEKVVFISMIFCLLHSLTQRGKSSVCLSLLIICTAPLFPQYNFTEKDKILVFLVYAAFSMLFSFVNFDKLSKYIIVIGAVASLVFFFLRIFISALNVFSVV